MRVASLNGRLCMITDGCAVDVHAASAGAFHADPAAVDPRWQEFTAWAASALLLESGFARPETSPPVVTKFPACVAGAYGEIELPQGGLTDWEVEQFSLGKSCPGFGPGRPVAGHARRGRPPPPSFLHPRIWPRR